MSKTEKKILKNVRRKVSILFVYITDTNNNKIDYNHYNK